MKWLIVDRLTNARLIIFVKCLKLVLLYKIFCKNKSKAVRNKDFKTYVNSKAVTFKPGKWNYYSIIRKS